MSQVFRTYDAQIEMVWKTFFVTVGAILLGFLEFTAGATIDPGSTSTTDGSDFKGNHSGQCVLPLQPRPDTSVKPEDGFRFGNTPYSRQEFSKSPEFMYSIMHDSIFALEFKTTAKNGVMFYVSAGCDRVDYIGLFMHNGKIVYTFSCGSGGAVIVSKNTYNDGKWHRVVFLRHSQEGRLAIDDVEDVRGTSPGFNFRVDELKSPFYVGGLSEELTFKTKSNLKGISNSFPGCIRNVEAQGEPLGRDTQTTTTDTTSCSSKVEEGSFFCADRGYLVLYDKYHVGQWTSISLDMKPRNLSGVLMAIHGKEDYLILQLIDGQVEFTVNNGAGPVTVTYTPGDKNLLCDGQFHTIQVAKADNFVTLKVDNVPSEQKEEMKGSSSTDTFDPFYVGGVPETSFSKRGIRTTDQFVGCVRNLLLNQEPQPMEKSRVIGRANLNTCPTE